MNDQVEEMHRAGYRRGRELPLPYLGTTFFKSHHQCRYLNTPLTQSSWVFMEDLLHRNDGLSH
jgi:hypothetical protein